MSAVFHDHNPCALFGCVCPCPGCKRTRAALPPPRPDHDPAPAPDGPLARQDYGHEIARIIAERDAARAENARLRNAMRAMRERVRFHHPVTDLDLARVLGEPDA